MANLILGESLNRITRMKPLVLVATGITIASCMVILSTVSTVSGQFSSPIVVPASNNGGIGALLLSLVFLGAILFNTFGRENGKINLSVTNEGNAENLADSQTNSNSNSNANATADSG